ncbi:MAG TPA: DUF692 family protein [Nitrospira sp.]|nr:DUF692 family protein [Nitrospira sp.]HNI18064.1 DUF692 family protein [Nitrospira sp.]
MKSEFTERAHRLPAHGLGLSVDVYSPDLLELVRALRDAALEPDYLEIFKATTSAQQWMRQQLPDLKLTYHGEGLWSTQPEFCRSGSGRQGVAEACAQLAALRSAWLNHECATKQMAGYAFGTYLPPLYTELSARMTAENVAYLQSQVDQDAHRREIDPALVLLEMPPLTYFGCGALPIPDFFRAVTDQASCGLVLDIGHLWTVYRYTGSWQRQRLEEFAAQFLDAFPMERVIEIHVAGLAELTIPHASGIDASGNALPYWIDAHGAPIPGVLFDLLAQVLSHPGLTSLKGVALEVDTKPIAMIVEEFKQFRERFGTTVQAMLHRDSPAPVQPQRSPNARSAERRQLTSEEEATLQQQYRHYVQLVTTQGDLSSISIRNLSLLGGSLDDLNRYRETYLPHELLHWGGELQDMFPDTCRALTESDVPLDRFVAVWFSKPRPEQDDYDFFLLKIDRFVEFATHACPMAAMIVMREAEELRAAYRQANEPIGSSQVRA